MQCDDVYGSVRVISKERSMPRINQGFTPVARAALLACAAAMAGGSSGAALANTLADASPASAKATGLAERVEAAAKQLRGEGSDLVTKGAPPVRQVQWRNG
jgi:hypothetical protein